MTLIKRTKLEYRLISMTVSDGVFTVFTAIETSLLFLNFRSSSRMPALKTVSREGGMTNLDSQVDGSDFSQSGPDHHK